MASQVVIDFDVWLCDQFGTRLQLVLDTISLQATLVANGVGQMVLEWPALAGNREFDYSLLKEDSQFEIWYRVDKGAGQLLGNTAWLLQKRTKSFQGQQKTITVHAVSADAVVSWPIVAYDSGTSEASKSGNADDVMKEIADENIGSAATDTNRDMSAYITIEGNEAAGVSVGPLGFSRRDMDKAITKFAEASSQAGTKLYWVVTVVNAPNAATRFLQFQTKPGQPGIDRGSTSSSPVVFSPERGNLENVEIEEDWSEVAYVAYAGGGGSGASREVQSAVDSSGVNNTPWGYIKEYWRDARNSGSDSAGIQDEADAALREARKRLRVSGAIVNTPSARFGVEWGHGDIVIVEVDGDQFNAMIDPLSISVQNRAVRIHARLRYEA